MHSLIKIIDKCSTSNKLTILVKLQSINEYYFELSKQLLGIKIKIVQMKQLTSENST